MKKMVLRLALASLLFSSFELNAREKGGDGGHGKASGSAVKGGGKGDRGKAVKSSGARGATVKSAGHRDAGRGGRHDGGRRGVDRHYGKHYRHHHGDRWYDHDRGYYFFGGSWYPWWYWPYTTDTDEVIWVETVPGGAVIAVVED